MSYLGWLAIAAVSYTCQVHCIAHIENERWQRFHFAFANIGTALAYLAHMRAMWSDPGFVPRRGSRSDARPPDNYCEKCDSIKPEGAHHCRKCGRCVQGMDHHCPWTNNCVGPGNIKFFLLFLLYVGVGCVYWMALLSWRAYCVYLAFKPPIHFDHPSVLVQPMCWLGSFLLCAAFLVFVVAMWSDQHQALVTATPLIDALKLARQRAQQRRKRQRAMENGEWPGDEDEMGIEDEETYLRRRRTLTLIAALSRACGERPHLRWLVPLKPPAPKSTSATRAPTLGRGLDGCTPAGLARARGSVEAEEKEKPE